LVVVDRSQGAADALQKAVHLARLYGAGLELFMSDAECALALSHAYVPTGVEKARQACIDDAHRYLQQLKDSVGAGDIPVEVDAVCDSPLYESIVHKAIRSQARLVIKSAAGTERRPFSLDLNDWQLMRTCPVTLMLTRGKPWPERLRMAAAVDASEEDSAFMRDVVSAAMSFSGSADGFDVLYARSPAVGASRHVSGEQALQGLMHEMQLERARLNVLDGHPESKLAEFARPRNYDVLFLGALTHRKDLTSQVGTLTASLVEALTCDFMLVKSHEYRSPVADTAMRGSVSAGSSARQR
jgi:universal stress protein E